MADDKDRAKGINSLRIQMNYDQNDAKGAWTDAAMKDSKTVETLVKGLPDAMVHRDHGTAMEKAE